MSAVDIVASILLIGGALIMLLGTVGLVRFPDVFTRMHASTKAAVVGVILMTAAAALEAGTVGGLLVLLLVVALLFLSGPLGMSLLARAAYHDPETPRTPQTRVLDVDGPPRGAVGMRVKGGASPWLALWLVVVWVALFGSFGADVLIGGVVAAGLIALAFRPLAPRWPEALLHPINAFRFVGHFAGQVVVATWDVLKTVFRPPGDLRPVVISVPVEARTRNEITLLMNAISFTPGTVALELHDQHLSVHVLDTDDPSAVVAEIKTMESLIMAASGARPDDDIRLTNLVSRKE